MKKFLNWLGFARNDVSKITRSLTKMVRDLETHSALKREEADAHMDKSFIATREADRADQVFTKLASILG